MGEAGAEDALAAAAPPPPQQPGAHPLAEEAERVASLLSGKLPDLPAVDPSGEASSHDGHQPPAVIADENFARPEPKGADAVAAVPTSADAREDATRADADVFVAAGKPAAGASAAVRGVARQRAAAVVGARVERLREASAGVFDEAAEDPGVRFLVVAAVLFLLFVMLWLFSFVLG